MREKKYTEKKKRREREKIVQKENEYVEIPQICKQQTTTPKRIQ